MSYIKYIYCPVCGEKMREDQRNCFKCGSLNFSNPLNRNLKEYQPEIKNNNKFINGDKDNIPLFNKINNDEFSTNTGNIKAFFIVNLIILITISLLIGLIFNKSLLSREFAFTLLSFLILYTEGISLQLIFMKANRKWWYAFIPIFDLYNLCDVVFNSKIIFILFFIPGINIIMSLLVLYNLAKMFDKNAFLTILFPYFVIPTIGFSSCSLFNGINYIVQYKGEDFTLQFYKYKKILKNLIFTLFSLAIIILVFTFI